MVCETLLDFELRHDQTMSLAMESGALHRSVAVLCRAVVDVPTLWCPSRFRVSIV